MDEDEYDEFGNYIGSGDAELQDFAAGAFDASAEFAIEADTLSVRDSEFMDVDEGNQIVLAEDKQYYPEADEVYPGVKTVLVDEDAQDVDEPIVNPMKVHNFSVLEKEPPKLKYSVDFMQSLMDNPSLVRNIAVVGHLHHGKTSVLDMFAKSTQERDWNSAKAPRYCDIRKDEQARELSIKTTLMSLVMQDTRNKSHLLHILDSPGHVDFCDEMEASLRLADGAMIVVDSVEGVMMVTDRAIRACVRNGIKITLCIAKLDRLILELKIPPQDAYFKIRHIIEEVNALIENYSVGTGMQQKLSPVLGNVCFCSGLHDWSFTLESFAMQYCESYKNSSIKASGLGAKLSATDLAPRMWGEWYWSKDQSKITKKKENGVVRTFVQFVLDPLYKLYSHVLGDEPATLIASLKEELGIKLSFADASLDPKKLLRIVMSKFFGDARGVVGMFVKHVPSPVEGSRYKVLSSYDTCRSYGSSMDDMAEGMATCDAGGPLAMHVTKLINSPDGSRFYALARIYSGTLRNTGAETVRVLGEDYSSQDQEDAAVAVVDNVAVSVARFSIDVAYASAGNLVLVEGIDAPIKKTATVFDSKFRGNVSTFQGLQYENRSTIRMSLEPLKPAELPKLVDSLRKVCKSYHAITTKVEESGEHVMIGPGELSLDCALHDLRHLFCSNLEITLADPIVSFCETVIETSGMVASGTTANNKNRISLMAEPLDKGLAADIEVGMLTCSGQPEERQHTSIFLQEKYNWDLLGSRSVWAFGPEDNSPNLFLNDTLPSEVDTRHLETAKESIIQGFRWAAKEGPLCDEPMRNVKLKLLDATIAVEPIYRGGGQIIPTARRAVYSSFLTASPRLMEPVYEIEVQTPADTTQAVMHVIHRRRGKIVSEIPKPGTPIYIMRGHVPVIESFGLESDLRSSTQGQAFLQKVFDHWQVLPGDPLDGDVILHPLEPAPKMAMARDFMVKMRRRKGLSDDVSIVKYFDDSMMRKMKEDNALNG